MFASATSLARQPANPPLYLFLQLPSESVAMLTMMRDTIRYWKQLRVVLSTRLRFGAAAPFPSKEVRRSLVNDDNRGLLEIFPMAHRELRWRNIRSRWFFEVLETK